MKTLKIFLSLLVLSCLLSLGSLAATVEFEDDYISDNEFVIASLNSVRPFISDKDKTEYLEDAMYWLTDIATPYNLKYVSFVGNTTGGARYEYHSLSKELGLTVHADIISALDNACLNDKVQNGEFETLKETASILTEAKIPYGVSLDMNDYVGGGYNRNNILASTFTINDFVPDNSIKTEFYDNNNYAIITTVGKTSYIIYQLEAYPRQNIIDWFNQTNANHLDKRAIIFTTSFTDKNGNMYTQHDWSLSMSEWIKTYKNFTTKMIKTMVNTGSPHDGENLWNACFVNNDNILCVVTSNDATGTNIVTNTFKTANGYPIVSIHANLEGTFSDANKAYPLLIKFSEEDMALDVRFAVPYYNKVGGYVKETQKTIKLDKLLEMPEPDPVLSLKKISYQANGNNVAYINGYENNLFKPNNNMTKAEACTIFARLLAGSQTIPEGFTSRFSDVKPEDWYYKAIAYLDANGYLYTTEGDKYNPNAKITRAEFVELAYFTSNLEATKSIKFTDVSETSKYYKAIKAAAASGLVNGYGDGSFKPDATITRAEVVTVINRLVSLVANERTVSKEHVDKVFSDISGHWAEYNILMASNDKVYSKDFYSINPDTLKEDKKTVYFENDYIKVSILKNNGVVSEIINKMTGENVVTESVTPWFTYIVNKSKANIQPSSVAIDNGRLKVTYKDSSVLYFIIDVKDSYFSVTLDSNIPSDASAVVMCQLAINAPWELDNPDAFGISGIPMTTTVLTEDYPGGSSKKVKGTVNAIDGVNAICSKFGVAFSRMTEHRDFLKKIVDDIDPKYGITSTHGGPYALDHQDIYYDYVIVQTSLNTTNAEETASLAKKYSVEQIDIHQGSTFVQGDFNFTALRTRSEASINKYIDAATFKKRVGDKFLEKGLQLSLHTYSSLVYPGAITLLSDPQYQKDIVTAEQTWTLREKISKSKLNLKTYEDASVFKTGEGNIPYNGHPGSKYILIDEEIILIGQGTTSGFINVKRGQCGTKAVAHEDGAIIYQLYGWFGGFQPKPLSPLFYKVAELTAKAYNDGGFEMIYLDGLESFGRDFFTTTSERYYVYAEFLRTVVSNCKVDPIIEYSSMFPYLWAARARGGAIDPAKRAFKSFMNLHLSSQSNYKNYFYTATAGWFNYCPDSTSRYKDTNVRSIYRDDLDYFGSLCIGYNFGTVCSGFSINNFNAPTRLSDNFMYYGLYTRLRESNYFAPEVREQLLNSEYEHKVFKQADGSWAFKEMKYLKHKVYDASVDSLSAQSFNNPFDEQTPFIRIEQRYSTEAKQEDGVLVYDFEEKAANELKGKNAVSSSVDIEGKIALKLKVYGNGSPTDALLLTLWGKSSTHDGRNDYFVPLNFTGWKEIVLVEVNNEDHEGYDFSGNGVEPATSPHNVAFSSTIKYSGFTGITVSCSGACTGVKLDTLTAYTPIDAPAKNPSITIGDKTITFNAELHSSDYIEYYPDENKAYLNYYTQIYNDDGSWKSDEAHTKEITFSGSVTVPSGNFTYKYKTEALTSYPTRAQVVIGLSGKVLANPDTWVAPTVDMPADIEKVTLY